MCCEHTHIKILRMIKLASYLLILTCLIPKNLINLRSLLIHIRYNNV